MKRKRQARYQKHNNSPQSLSEFQEDILKEIGLTLIVIHEVEFYLAKAFILFIDKEKGLPGKSFSDLFERWDKQTLGRLIRDITNRFDLEPEIGNALLGFVAMRNRLIHGITMEERFNFHTRKGQLELNRFVYVLFNMALVLVKVFRGCFIAGEELTNFVMEKKGIAPPFKLTKWEREQVGYYLKVFSKYR
jgi:hypothetical protein